MFIGLFVYQPMNRSCITISIETSLNAVKIVQISGIVASKHGVGDVIGHLNQAR